MEERNFSPACRHDDDVVANLLRRHYVNDGGKGEDSLGRLCVLCFAFFIAGILYMLARLRQSSKSDFVERKNMPLIHVGSLAAAAAHANSRGEEEGGATRSRGM